VSRAGAPWFVLVGGINGAGKSTFSQTPDTLVELLELSSAESIEVLNPDTLTRRITQERPEIALDEANKQAADETDELVRKRIESREGHFVVETVLSTEKYKPVFERARQLGWNILFVYVALISVDEAIRRVAHRVTQGGHDVPEAKIRQRWPKSLANLSWFWQRADACFLFFNPSDFQNPVHLASKQKSWLSIRVTHDCLHALSAVLDATARELQIQ
jgi:predicted ABC-type ATPase